MGGTQSATDSVIVILVAFVREQRSSELQEPREEVREHVCAQVRAVVGQRALADELRRLPAQLEVLHNRVALRAVLAFASDARLQRRPERPQLAQGALERVLAASSTR